MSAKDALSETDCQLVFGCSITQLLTRLQMRMPFGKYAQHHLIDLPEAYLVWFKQKGWPNGELGHALALALSIRENGLENLIRPLLQTHK